MPLNSIMTDNNYPTSTYLCLPISLFFLFIRNKVTVWLLCLVALFFSFEVNLCMCGCLELNVWSLAFRFGNIISLPRKKTQPGHKNACVERITQNCLNKMACNSYNNNQIQLPPAHGIRAGLLIVCFLSAVDFRFLDSKRQLKKQAIVLKKSQKRTKKRKVQWC